MTFDEIVTEEISKLSEAGVGAQPGTVGQVGAVNQTTGATQAQPGVTTNPSQQTQTQPSQQTQQTSGQETPEALGAKFMDSIAGMTQNPTQFASALTTALNNSRGRNQLIQAFSNLTFDGKQFGMGQGTPQATEANPPIGGTA